MRTIHSAWFEFKNEMSFAHGAEMLMMPERRSAALRGERIRVAGRSGSVLVTDGEYDDIDLRLRFALPDIARLGEVCAWLRGEGLLRFSDLPQSAYQARVLRPPRFAPIAPRLQGQLAEVTFSCHPFLLRWPPVKVVRLNRSGETLHNPGTAPAQPRVSIYGSGDFSLTIAGQTMAFTGVSQGIVVDCDTLDVTDLSGAALLNDRAFGEPWRVPAGDCAVEWKIESGGIDHVDLLPRWRDF
ncbi:MAG: hypothetical protein IJ074_13415 [Clostridia bacterium]|nr:hypothetical protein [Clostridia bacterium]